MPRHKPDPFGPPREETDTSDQRLRDCDEIGRLIQDALRHEGALAFARKILLRQLRVRFKRVPTSVRDYVESQACLPIRDAWLITSLTADTLDDVGILPRTSSRS